MKTFVWIILGLLVVAAILVAASGKKRGSGDATVDREKPRRKNPLTEREQAMYERLISSMPTLVVLAQVSFSALLHAKTPGTRNTFDRKTADFVVCDRAFQVLAVIEIDDNSHKGQGAKDARRDALLTEAGYRVIRYANIPDIKRLQADMANGRGAEAKPAPAMAEALDAGLSKPMAFTA